MILIMGQVGSGKSVQCSLLVDEGRVQWLSTGVLLRAMVLSDERKKEMQAGKILSDDEVIELVRDAVSLAPASPEIMLDGFPRTMRQIDWILQQSDEKYKLQGVVHLEASEKTVLKRLLARGRDDDNEVSIKKRFSEFATKTQPIMQYLRDKGVPVFTINGDRTPEEVHQEITEALDKISEL